MPDKALKGISRAERDSKVTVHRKEHGWAGVSVSLGQIQKFILVSGEGQSKRPSAGEPGTCAFPEGLDRG